MTKITPAAIAAAAPAAYPFQVWYDAVNEDEGTSHTIFAKAFATWDQALGYCDEVEGYTDGLQIIGSTEAASAEILADYMKACEEAKLAWDIEASNIQF